MERAKHEEALAKLVLMFLLRCTERRRAVREIFQLQCIWQFKDFISLNSSICRCQTYGFLCRKIEVQGKIFFTFIFVFEIISVRE